MSKKRLTLLGAVLAAGLVLAACGGTSHAASVNTGASTSTTTAGGGGAGGFGAALTAFTTCMSDHGITLSLGNGRRNGNGGPPSTTPGETRPARPAGGGGFFGGGGAGFANRFDTPPAGVDPTKYKTALTACKSKLPTGNANPVNNTAFQAYRSCLKDHGVTLPTAGTGTPGTTTPGTTTPGTTGGTSGGINRNDPKVKAALATCAPLLPAGGFGRSTTTTTAPSA